MFILSLPTLDAHFQQIAGVKFHDRDQELKALDRLMGKAEKDCHGGIYLTLCSYPMSFRYFSTTPGGGARFSSFLSVSSHLWKSFIASFLFSMAM